MIGDELKGKKMLKIEADEVDVLQSICTKCSVFKDEVPGITTFRSSLSLAEPHHPHFSQCWGPSKLQSRFYALSHNCKCSNQV